MPERRYTCRTCGREVRLPGEMGRSWCPHCETYNQPTEMVVERIEEPVKGA